MKNVWFTSTLLMVILKACLTDLYATERSPKAQDNSTGLEKLRTLAEKGNAGGKYRLGVMYDDGEGVPKNVTQALNWYRKAADQGNADSQTLLASLYANGTGVPQDYAQAVSRYHKAAAQGHVAAQNYLGTLYYNGQGVPRDFAQAASLFRKAADQGNERARKNLSTLSSNTAGDDASTSFVEGLKNIAIFGGLVIGTAIILDKTFGGSSTNEHGRETFSDMERSIRRNDERARQEDLKQRQEDARRYNENPSGFRVPIPEHPY